MAALGPVAGGLAGEMAETARGVELTTRVLRGGVSFGLYSGMSADDKENRLLEGVKGFAVGAGFDLALGAPGYLMGKGLAEGPEDASRIIQETTNVPLDLQALTKQSRRKLLTMLRLAGWKCVRKRGIGPTTLVYRARG